MQEWRGKEKWLQIKIIGTNNKNNKKKNMFPNRDHHGHITLWGRPSPPSSWPCSGSAWWPARCPRCPPPPPRPRPSARRTATTRPPGPRPAAAAARPHTYCPAYPVWSAAWRTPLLGAITSTRSPAPSTSAVESKLQKNNKIIWKLILGKTRKRKRNSAGMLWLQPLNNHWAGSRRSRL